MNDLKLDRRLSTAIKYLRSGMRLADIGTDHAYLPIYAVMNGISSFAIASDINEGPINRAKLHIESYSLSDKIATLRTDGLCDLEKYSPDDIVIFGMGGELIVNILNNAPWVKTGNRRFILQPMTNVDTVRLFLAENGFDIIGETLSEEAGKLYVTICCEYTGKTVSLSFAESLLGRYNIENALSSPLFEKLTQRVLNTYQVRLDGKKSAGINTTLEETVIKEISCVIEKIEKSKEKTI